ncbi:MAG: SDR family oxidoreductase [Janthinobacterium lividum]
MSTILVTGATGGLGHAVVETLLQTINPAQLAVLARDPAKAADLQAQGVAVRQGDYSDYESLTAAFAGVEKLYFVATSSMTDRIQQHENVVKAATAAGVKHLVYTSFQRKTEDGTSPVAFIEEAHLATEKLIKQSGLTYTILKHALYLDVFPPFFGPQVLENNTIYLPAGTGRGAYASRHDLAVAGAAVLTSPGHENQTYELAANTTYSLADFAEALSTLSGRAIQYVAPSPAEFVAQLTQAGVPAENSQMAAALMSAIAQGEFDFPDPTLEKLLGRKPESPTEFLKAAYKL